jgi:4-hydroxy-2-oxoheptanedioate aldolase
MRESVVKALWADGQAACCTLVKFADPRASEIAAMAGFDCLWIDLEHHSWSMETAENMIRAARLLGCDVMARPAKGEVMRMGRLLEAGATGILYPRVETVEEAKECVRWAKFAPLGERGFDGGNADSPYGSMDMASYIEAVNRETFILVQIESPTALPNARAIAEVDGTDGLFFGPGDFSVLAGVPGQFGSDVVQSAVRQVCEAARAAGKQFGTLVFSAEQAARMLDMGATFVTMGCDIPMLKGAMEQLRDQFRAVGLSMPRLGLRGNAASEYTASAT